MSDQDTRDKRAERRKNKKQWGNQQFGRKPPTDPVRRMEDKGHGEDEDEWEHGDDLFHDPTDGDIRELDFHDDDEG